MDRGQKNHDVLLEDLSALVRDLVNDLDDAARRIIRKPPAVSLQNLRSTVSGIDAPEVHRGAPLERYMKEWAEHVRGDKESLDKRAIRFLCWVPEVALDLRFLALVVSSGIELNRRTLAGLVRSCHCMWEEMPQMNPSLRIIKGLLRRYRGSNQVLRKWQAHAEALLTADAPRIMAEKLVGGGWSPASFIDEWSIEPQSAFFRRVVECAAAACRDRLDQPAGQSPCSAFQGPSAVARMGAVRVQKGDRRHHSPRAHERPVPGDDPEVRSPFRRAWRPPSFRQPGQLGRGA